MAIACLMPAFYAVSWNHAQNLRRRHHYSSAIIGYSLETVYINDAERTVLSTDSPEIWLLHQAVCVIQ